MDDDSRATVEALSRRLRAADRAERCEAAKALFEHYREPLRRHIRCELARRQQRLQESEGFHSRVETHVNSAYLKLLQRLERGPLADQDEVHFLAYLKAIVRNTLQTRRRREERARTEPLAKAQAYEPSVAQRLAEDEERAWEEQALAQRRSRLTAEEQSLLELYSSGVSYRQIAAQLGGSPGQHRARMSRILRKLR